MAKYLTDEELRSLIAPTIEAVPVGSQWQHVKGGDLYTVEGIALLEGGQLPVVIYRANREGATAWVRTALDFTDGRFLRKMKGGA